MIQVIVKMILSDDGRFETILFEVVRNGDLLFPPATRWSLMILSVSVPGMVTLLVGSRRGGHASSNQRSNQSKAFAPW